MEVTIKAKNMGNKYSKNWQDIKGESWQEAQREKLLMKDWLIIILMLIVLLVFAYLTAMNQ